MAAAAGRARSRRSGRSRSTGLVCSTIAVSAVASRDRDVVVGGPRGRAPRREHQHVRRALGRSVRRARPRAVRRRRAPKRSLSMSVLDPPRPAPPRCRPRPSLGPRPHAPRQSRVRRCGAGRKPGSGVGPAGAARAARRGPPSLYLWGLGASGWANSYYSAAVQAGTKSWKAFFFGSTDSSNFITVDKTPASLWVMEISARASSASTRGACSCRRRSRASRPSAILFAAVKRWFSPAAGLIAGAVFALTPVGRADVPVQQPRRDARALSRRERVRDDACARRRPAALARRRRGAGRLRVPRQGAAGVPRTARRSGSCT